jgi:hypothetical protein
MAAKVASPFERRNDVIKRRKDLLVNLYRQGRTTLNAAELERVRELAREMAKIPGNGDANATAYRALATLCNSPRLIDEDAKFNKPAKAMWIQHGRPAVDAVYREENRKPCAFVLEKETEFKQKKAKALKEKETKDTKANSPAAANKSPAAGPASPRAAGPNAPKPKPKPKPGPPAAAAAAAKVKAAIGTVKVTATGPAVARKAVAVAARANEDAEVAGRVGARAVTVAQAAAVEARVDPSEIPAAQRAAERANAAMAAKAAAAARAAFASATAVQATQPPDMGPGSARRSPSAASSRAAALGQAAAGLKQLAQTRSPPYDSDEAGRRAILDLTADLSGADSPAGERLTPRRLDRRSRSIDSPLGRAKSPKPPTTGRSPSAETQPPEEFSWIGAAGIPVPGSPSPVAVVARTAALDNALLRGVSPALASVSPSVGVDPGVPPAAAVLASASPSAAAAVLLARSPSSGVTERLTPPALRLAPSPTVSPRTKAVKQTAAEAKKEAKAKEKAEDKAEKEQTAERIRLEKEAAKETARLEKEVTKEKVRLEKEAKKEADKADRLVTKAKEEEKAAKARSRSSPSERNRREAERAEVELIRVQQEAMRGYLQNVRELKALDQLSYAESLTTLNAAKRVPWTRETLRDELARPGVLQKMLRNVESLLVWKVTTYENILRRLPTTQLADAKLKARRQAYETALETVVQRIQDARRPERGWMLPTVYLASIYAAIDDIERTIPGESRQVVREQLYEAIYRLVNGYYSFQGSNNYQVLGGAGTGKTTIAELMGRVFFAMGVLVGGQATVLSRSDLIGSAVGETAIKTENAILGGLERVVFIDEAYSLNRECDRYAKNISTARCGLPPPPPPPTRPRPSTPSRRGSRHSPSASRSSRSATSSRSSRTSASPRISPLVRTASSPPLRVSPRQAGSTHTGSTHTGFPIANHHAWGTVSGFPIANHRAGVTVPLSGGWMGVPFSMPNHHPGVTVPLSGGWMGAPHPLGRPPGAIIAGGNQQLLSMDWTGSATPQGRSGRSLDCEWPIVPTHSVAPSAWARVAGARPEATRLPRPRAVDWRWNNDPEEAPQWSGKRLATRRWAGAGGGELEGELIATRRWAGAGGGDFGGEAINQLVTMMIPLGGLVSFAIAGYKDAIGCLIKSNQGFSRRFQNVLTLTDLTVSDMTFAFTSSAYVTVLRKNDLPAFDQEAVQYILALVTTFCGYGMFPSQAGDIDNVVKYFGEQLSGRRQGEDVPVEYHIAQAFSAHANRMRAEFNKQVADNVLVFLPAYLRERERARQNLLPPAQDKLDIAL